MIAELLNRGFLGNQLSDVARILAEGATSLRAGDRAAKRCAKRIGVEAGDLDDAYQAVAALKKRGLEPGIESAYLPSDPVASVVQATLEAFFDEVGAVMEPQGQGLAPGQVGVTDRSLKPEWVPQAKKSLGERFDQTDARWLLGFMAARGISLFRHKRAFPKAAPPQVPIADKARILLVGDWGSGLPRSRMVSYHMRDALFNKEGRARERHVIHLGDVYYAGFEREYRNRFLAHWPVRPGEKRRVGSWCLNGNHDMFSGGHAYFDFLLAEPRFAGHNGTSYFCLENKDWQIIGLDSAYESRDVRGETGDLYGPQAAWVAQRRAAAPQKKAVLLTHHPLFSAYGGGSEEMGRKLEPVLTATPITAWFWGHEHLCAIYKPHPMVPRARLLGHGGVPASPNTGKLPKSVIKEVRDSLQSGLNRWVRFGFAILDFDGDRLSVRYRNELGVDDYSEVF